MFHARKAIQFAMALTLFLVPVRAVAQQNFKVGVTRRSFVPKGTMSGEAQPRTLWSPPSGIPQIRMPWNSLAGWEIQKTRLLRSTEPLRIRPYPPLLTVFR